MSDHALIKKAAPTDLKVAKEAAGWLTDAVACATQDRQFLRHSDEANEMAIEAIEGNGVVACLRAMKNQADLAAERDRDSQRYRWLRDHGRWQLSGDELLAAIDGQLDAVIDNYLDKEALATHAARQEKESEG